MEIVLVLCIGAMCICCFVIGAKVGQAVSKGEDIMLPTINPIEAYRERENKKHARIEQDKLETIMRNIERYNGTDEGQEDIPK